MAGLGQKQTVDFTLKIATANQKVTVTEDAPLINPQNPNTSTTLTARVMESLPNPGGDMTYPIQFAAGALMNTAGSGNDFVGGTNGYGNVQFNGLSSLSNGYIVDGLETNDPLTNLNSGLSTNLVRSPVPCTIVHRGGHARKPTCSSRRRSQLAAECRCREIRRTHVAWSRSVYRRFRSRWV